MSTLSLLPWLRRGLSRHAAVGTDGLRVTLQASLGSDVLQHDVALAGPDRVIGLAVGQVVRRFPAAGSIRASSSDFCHLELATPDLPWRYSPEVPDSDGHLGPWLILVVVERAPERRSDAAAVLTVDAAELPDLAESWAWAHVQVDAPFSTLQELEQLVDGEPGVVRARLLCPRRLRPERRYHACLVPRYAAGVWAGLAEGGTQPDAASLAWSSGDGVVRLPVYETWSFTTGRAGDFETLARRLQPRAVDDGVGSRPLDLADPGGGIATSSGRTILQHGALASPQPPDEPLVGSALGTFEAELEQALEPIGSDPETDPYDPAVHDPVVGPPVYGRLHAQPGATQVSGGWLRELNLTVSNRLAAATGAALVRQHQERLMASAWRQAAGVQRVRERVRRGRAMVAVAGRLEARLHGLGDTELMQVGASMTRQVDGDGQTLWGELVDSDLPEGLLSPTFRRVMRRGGTATRSLGGVQGSRSPAAALLNAAVDHPDRVQAGLGLRVGSPSGSPDVAGRLRAHSPTAAIATRLEQSVRGSWSVGALSSAWSTEPSFEEPLVDLLVDWKPGLLLPGIGQVPDESVSLLDVREDFVVSLMVGANHELGRELLWREFPATPGATWLRQFWDSEQPDIAPIAGWPSSASLASRAATTSPGLVLFLKGELLRQHPDLRVFAVPAVWSDGKRVPSGADPTEPVFRGALSQGFVFLGFELDGPTARGSAEEADQDPGWFFAFQEHPTGLRFGLDEAVPGASGTPPSTWSDLSWRHLVSSEADLDDLTHAAVGAGPLMGLQREDELGVSLEWGASAAVMARITLQRPVRVYLHADSLLAEED